MKDRDHKMTPDEFATLNCSTSTSSFNNLDGPNAYYKFTAAAGKSYKIKVTMMGYFNRYNAAVIRVGGTENVVFKMTKKPARPAVIIRATRLQILKKIYFAFGRSTILPNSLKILDEVAASGVALTEVRRQACLVGHVRLENLTAVEQRIAASAPRAHQGEYAVTTS